MEVRSSFSNLSVSMASKVRAETVLSRNQSSSRCNILVRPSRLPGEGRGEDSPHYGPISLHAPRSSDAGARGGESRSNWGGANEDEAAKE